MTPEQSSPQPTRLPDAVLRPAVGNVFETTVEQLATAIRLGVFVVGARGHSGDLVPGSECDDVLIGALVQRHNPGASSVAFRAFSMAGKMVESGARGKSTD